jgi:apolipoprotein N-acyltransferase
VIAGALDSVDGKVYNSACLIPPKGLETYYYKEHLVPFGEYVPLPRLLFFVNRMVNDAIGEFSIGHNPLPLEFDKARMGMTICYENIFPELVRDRVRNGATIVANITNDTWFGFSAAAAQHFSASCFRAVENRRPVVRAANSGISGAIDSGGRILLQTPLFKEAAHVVRIQPQTGISIYQRYGDFFAVFMLIFSAFMVLGTYMLKKNSRFVHRRFE